MSLFDESLNELRCLADALSPLPSASWRSELAEAFDSSVVAALPDTDVRDLVVLMHLVLQVQPHDLRSAVSLAALAFVFGRHARSNTPNTPPAGGTPAQENEKET